MKDKIAVVFSLILIFAFNAVDCSISPLVEPLHTHFGISTQHVLLFISWGTIGILAGLILGPGLVKTYQPKNLIIAASSVMAVSLILFLLVHNFTAALWARLIFGFCSGLIASIMWWVAFYGVDRVYYQAMISVLMSARALSTAFGVPFAGFSSKHAGLIFPFTVFAVLILISGAVLFFNLRKAETTSGGFNPASLLKDYWSALKLKYGFTFYLGFMTNRICYFGIYSIAGIWFIKHYGLKTENIAAAFFYIGLGEALINFFVPKLISKFGYGFMFLSSIVMSGAALFSFISGNLPVSAAIGAITLFVIMDRIYCMAVVITIPDMFPESENKTVFGTLNTLTAWTGLAIVSWFAGKYMDAIGITAFQSIISSCFLLGAAILIFVQWKTVLRKNTKVG
ncbi:MAG: MFS transporter [Firmicutes bacterium]|nr:MFS transporter [Bacillota bacterium]